MHVAELAFSLLYIDSILTLDSAPHCIIYPTISPSCIRLQLTEIHPKLILFVNISDGTRMTGTLERCRDDGNV
jgi:hypothetical protein